MKAKIAVITPVYNAENTIEDALTSLLNQTFQDWVSIIVNDGSTDETRNIISKFDDPRFVVIDLEENKGRGFARQVALEQAQKTGAKYMSILDSDDLLYPHALHTQYCHMEKNPDITLTSFSLGYTDKNNGISRILSASDQEFTFHFNEKIKFKKIPLQSSIIRITDIGNTCFNTNMFYSEDKDFIMRLLVGKKYAFVPKVTYLYDPDSNFSYKKYKEAQKWSLVPFRSFNYNNLFYLKKSLLIYLKITFVFIVLRLNRKDIYFNMIGRKPNLNEINFHKNWLRVRKQQPIFHVNTPVVSGKIEYADMT